MIRYPSFLKDPHRVALANAGNFRHRLDGDLCFFNALDAVFFSFRLQPQTYCIANIGKGFFARFPLGVATAQIGAAHRPPFFALEKMYSVCH